jgi:hypothetical protein
VLEVMPLQTGSAVREQRRRRPSALMVGLDAALEVALVLESSDGHTTREPGNPLEKRSGANATWFRSRAHTSL